MRDNSLNRRHFLSLSGAAAISAALAACSSDSGTSTPSTGKAASSSAIAALGNTVPGFNTTPTWASTHSPKLKGLTALEMVQPAFSQGRAWMLFKDAQTRVVAAAVDMASPTNVALSSPVTVTDKINASDGSGFTLMPVASPSPALLLHGAAKNPTLFTVSNNTVTTREAVLPADADDSSIRWQGDIAFCTAGGDGSTGYALTTSTNTWTKLTSGGADWKLIGACMSDGKVEPVTLNVVSASHAEAQIKAGARTKTLQTFSPGEDIQDGQVLWSIGDRLLIQLNQRTVPFDAQLNPHTDTMWPRIGATPDDPSPLTIQAMSADRTEAIVSNSYYYSSANNTVNKGIATTAASPEWSLRSVTLRKGTIYACGKGDSTTPATTSYTGTHGELSPTAHANTAAPSLVGAGGEGLFWSHQAWVISSPK